ncbi:MAG: hypothetical protein IJW75_04170 [Alphaproteobacteria bacterium]|nr:hypothetical protein [Alphaproteobacteria bacterium]
MRKSIILCLAATVLSMGCAWAIKPYESKTKDELKFDVALYGGYNFTGNMPVFGSVIGFEAFFLRADLDIGGTSVNHPLCNKFFPTISPSLGFVIGNKHKAYVMAGFQNYGYIATTDITECAADNFYSDAVHFKVKLGYQCTVWKRLFLSAEVCHLFEKKETGCITFPNSNVRIGAGWKF